MISPKLLVVLVALGVATARADEHAAPPSLSPQDATALHADEVMGHTLYLHDQAAAVATDAVIALDAFREERRVHGWITEAHGDAVTVTFIDRTPAALYRATVSDTGELVGRVEAFASPQPLSPFEAGAAAARAAALGAKFHACTDRYNTVVLPLGDGLDGKWSVYLLPATSRREVIPIGGAYRMRIDKNVVVSQRGFAKTCIALQDDPRAVGLLITHLLDPTPTEVHVFWSLWAHKDMYVGTTQNDAVWMIHDGHISLVQADH